MTDRPAFTSAMAALAIALPTAGRPITPQTFEVYWRALAPLTDAEFQRGADTCLRRCRFFPVPAELLEAARPPTDPHAAAFRMLNRALLLTDYDPEGGVTWSGIRIRAELGEAAYQAFHACGGAAGFRDYDSGYHGPAIRKAFLASFSTTIQREPRLALPNPDHHTVPPGPRLQALIAGVGRALPSDSGARP